MTATYGWDNQPVDDTELAQHDDQLAELAHLDLEAKELAFETTKAIRRLRAQKAAKDEIRREELGTTQLPTLVRLDTFLARPLDPTTHRIEGLWPIGARVLLSAQWKAGKTTLRDNVVRSLVDGDPFLDRHPVTPLPDGQTVVILDFELDDTTLQRWLADHQIENQHNVHVLSMRGHANTFDIRDEDLRQKWADALSDVQCAVLIIDCLRPILDALGMDESHDAGVFLVAFDNLLKQAGAREALVIHHMGHGPERARGDSRLRDWPDAEWRLVRDKDTEDDTSDDPTGARYFTAYGRDVNHPQTELTYDPQTRHLRLRAGAGGRKKAAGRRKYETAMGAVMRSVHAQPGIGRNAILTAVGGHKPSIVTAIEMLVEDGLITRHVDGQNHHYYPTQPPEGTEISPPSPPGPTGPRARQMEPGPSPYVVGPGSGLGQNHKTDTTESKAYKPETDATDQAITRALGPPCPHCDTRIGHQPNCPQRGDTDDHF